MTITSLTVRTAMVPMEPHRTASGTVSASPLVLISLETSEGATGQSILFCYTPAALTPLAEMVRGMTPLLVDQPLTPSALSDMLYARFRLLGGQGLVAMAIAGLDMAMWDALAHQAGMPLHRLLGGAPKAIMPYGAIGYDGEDGSAQVAEALAVQGFRGVKAKIGYPTVDEDLAVIRAIRSAVGEDVAVMVDYNQSLDATEAEARLAALDDEGLVWVEEPVAAQDFQALARLGDTCLTALQAGENWWGPLEFRQAIGAGARDRLMPDVMKCGGVTGWMRIAAIAAAEGIPVSNHLWPEISAQLMCATPTASWMEYSDWWNPILSAPLRLKDGYIDIDGVLGTGVRFDEAALAGFLT